MQRYSQVYHSHTSHVGDQSPPAMPVFKKERPDNVRTSEGRVGRNTGFRKSCYGYLLDGDYVPWCLTVCMFACLHVCAQMWLYTCLCTRTYMFVRVHCVRFYMHVCVTVFPERSQKKPKGHSSSLIIELTPAPLCVSLHVTRFLNSDI